MRAGDAKTPCRSLVFSVYSYIIKSKNRPEIGEHTSDKENTRDRCIITIMHPNLPQVGTYSSTLRVPHAHAPVRPHQHVATEHLSVP